MHLFHGLQHSCLLFAAQQTTHDFWWYTNHPPVPHATPDITGLCKKKILPFLNLSLTIARHLHIPQAGSFHKIHPATLTAKCEALGTLRRAGDFGDDCDLGPRGGEAQNDGKTRCKTCHICDRLYFRTVTMIAELCRTHIHISAHTC